MLMNTHMILANNFFEVANEKKIYLVNKKRFIWGNIKPDCTPKYKMVKHYYDESIDMVIEKINKLAKLSVSDVYYDYGKNKFSEELGVICHFICDFFCLPHNERWRFNSAMKKHVSYENTLAKVAKAYKPTHLIDKSININDIRKFIVDNKKIYNTNKCFENDLEFSYLVCNSVINLVLNEIMKNEYYGQKRAI